MSEKFKKSNEPALHEKGVIAAANFLKLKDYKILEIDYKSKYGQIDLITLSDTDSITFIQVSVRRATSSNNEIPEPAVTLEKRKRFERIALEYLASKAFKENQTIRFDYIGLCVAENGVALLAYQKGAFQNNE